MGDNPLGSAGVHARTFRLPEQPEFRLRTLGPRVLDEVPPRELVEVMRRIGADGAADSDERVLRETPRLYDRVSLTQAARSVLTSLLDLLPRGGAGGLTGAGNGRVSIEVSPELAHDTDATVAEAQKLPVG